MECSVRTKIGAGRMPKRAREGEGRENLEGMSNDLGRCEEIIKEA